MITFKREDDTYIAKKYMYAFFVAAIIGVAFAATTAHAQNAQDQIPIDTIEETATTTEVEITSDETVETTATPPEVPPGSVPAPVVVEVDNSGRILMRGIVTETNADTLTLKSWGGTWTIRVGAGSTIIPGNLAAITVGSFVGVDGQVAGDQALTIDATVVRDWTTAPYTGEGAPTPVPEPAGIGATVTGAAQAGATTNNASSLQATLEQLKARAQALLNPSQNDEDADEEDAVDDETDEEEENNEDEEDENDERDEEDRWDGTVEDVTDDTFTLVTDDDETFTVSIEFDTDVYDEDGEYMDDVTDIDEGAEVEVRGTIDADDDDTIVATEVHVE